MDWSKLYFGKVTREEVERAIDDANWQSLRQEMKGKSLEVNIKCLVITTSLRVVVAQVLKSACNKLCDALSRGGLIKVGDYRNYS